MRTSIARRIGGRRIAVAAVAAGLTLAIAPGIAFAATLKGNANFNEIHGTASGDSIYGYGGNDKLYGAAGPDHVFGGTGADHVVGGDGNDEVDGGTGADKLYGLDGADTIRARDSHSDTIFCGNGTDTVYADYRDVFGTGTIGDPKGTCENIKHVNPWVLPVRLADMSEGKAGLNDPHHDYPSVDLQAPTGSDVRAVRGGFVEAAGWAPLGQGWCGNGVVIRGWSGGQYMYCHMNHAPTVNKGQVISPGRKIGVVGSTGNSTGPHLHLQIWANSMGADGYYNGRCPQRMLTAIANGTAVPLPKDLPRSGCTY